MLRALSRSALQRVRKSRRVRRWVRDPWLRLTVPVPTPRAWAFICACSNSGTTLLNDMLGQHPDIGTIDPEGQFWTERLPKAVGGPEERLWALRLEHYAMDEHAQVDAAMVKRDWARGFNDPHRTVLLEKSPPNAVRMRWLQRHFEPASFLCIVRNGYAVAEGIARKTGHPIETTARQWAEANARMKQDFARVERGLWIRYEDLAADPRATMERIASFLDVDPEPLRQAAAARHAVFGVESEVVDMNAQSLARLTDAQRAAIEDAAGDALAEHGYRGSASS